MSPPSRLSAFICSRGHFERISILWWLAAMVFSLVLSGYVAVAALVVLL